MATILFSAAGAAAGAALGGAVMGLSSVVIGRAIGATIGRAIDQQLLGTGSETVETGKVERFRLTGASEGAVVPRLWGRSRVAGQVIWASRFQETVTTQGGGKGAPSTAKVREYSYTVSLAIALCEGEIARVGRIWADGVEIAPGDMTLRVYSGSEDQLPDPLIEAIEGTGNAPAYRGIAYVVIENLQLADYGSRVPQLSFEVMRTADSEISTLADLVQGVALIPGTGEYALATTPVHYDVGFGEATTANMNTPSGKTDVATSLEALRGELPKVGSVTLVVSWFGSDLRAPQVELHPKVDQAISEGAPMAWQVAGVTRPSAQQVPAADGRAVYGGTPSDGAVAEAIVALREGGQETVFYPFILMDQMQGNDLIDPYSGDEGQPPLPWRGRITLSHAPGHPLSPDGTQAAVDEVAALFGTATPEEFALQGTPGDPTGFTVVYSGSDGWSYRRFILHYASLCKAAGGVAAFCIGSELRGLTTIRGPQARFPVVEQLCALAADVRAILGPDCKISYAADWSEYFGYHPTDGSGDVYFHLDPLWADPNIDFIGIDNYMPLSDWRDGDDHLDAEWGTIYDLDYLKANIEGGEGYDWYYPSDQARDVQRRLPITDGAFGKDWVFRYKDIRAWWGMRHVNRISGVEGDILNLGTAVAQAFNANLGQITNAFTANDSDRPAALVELAGGNSYFYRDLTLDPQKMYTLRMLVKAADDQLQTSSLNYYDGAHHRKSFTVGAEWTEVSILFRPGRDEVTICLADNRAGGNATGLLVSEIALIPDDAGTEWVPESKPIWFTELGCPAVDKGPNAPNVFYDPKSSESAFAPFSNGARDDLIQQQYLRAILEYWRDADVNPVSKVYGGPMLDLERAHVWTWDARPFPQFPARRDLWSDGANYGRGHWLNGRATAQPLAAVIAEICNKAGVTDLDLSRVHGLVRGYVVAQAASARSALQPLMLAHGVEAAERDGKIVFFNRDGKADHTIAPEMLALTDDQDGTAQHIRTPEAESAGRVLLTFVESQGSYETRAVEAILPDEQGGSVSSTEMALVLSRDEAQAMVARWLAEARVARDQVRLALPPSTLGIGAGDVIRLPDGDFRIDRVDQGAAREIEAVRVERGVYTAAAMAEGDDGGALSAFVSPVPVAPVFLDLPLLTGQEVPYAPHIAITASPWPGTAAVYSAVEDAGYRLNTLVGRGAVAGVTETPLLAAAPSRWDRGAGLRVRLTAGSLSSVGLTALFAGANAAAIGDGTPGRWEVFQFAEATLVAPRTYELTMRLRGQAGTEGEILSDHPAGSYFVLLDGGPVQIDFAPDAVGMARHFRIGPGGRPMDDPSYVHKVEAFEGIGLRPYAPCHLRARANGTGDLALSWVRRTRTGGDSWTLADVPLGEVNEAYHMRVLNDQGTILRDLTLTASAWTYSAALQAADGAVPPFAIEVAQLSEQFGPGPYRRIEING